MIQVRLVRLVVVDTHGTNSRETAEDKGTQTLMQSGQGAGPVIISTNDTSQSRWYTASGEVWTGPVDICTTLCEVARNDWPPKLIMGCKLEQSVVAT